MYLHRGWEVQLIGMRGHLFDDSKLPQAFEIELGRWSSRFEIFAEEPHIIANFEFGRGNTVFVSLFGIGGLGPEHLILEVSI